MAVSSIAIRPWRFDHARNANLALIPGDAEICVSLDMDEVLVPGWRLALERAWIPGTTRLRYPYVWNWSADGRPQRSFFGDKIHHRHGYAWKHPVHETISPLAGTVEKVQWTEDVHIHHHADDTKSRGQYLPLLALAAAEDPDDDRTAHYYGRELMFKRRWEEAITELKRHLSLPRATWNAERAASMRFIGRCFKELGKPAEAHKYLLLACVEAPDAREPWFDFAKLCLDAKDWIGGVWAVKQLLAITEAPKHYLRDLNAWSYGPYDVGSICAYYAGMLPLSQKWLDKALEMEPNHPRLLKNRQWIFPKE